MALRAAIASGNWSNPAIWNNGVLPVAGDIVASNGFTVTIDQNINASFLTNRVQSPVVIYPAMTSNTTPSGIVTASGIFSASFPAWNAFDQVTFNNWLSNLPTGWVAYEFTSPKIVQIYQMVPPGNNAPGSVPRNWTFEAWDGSSWVVLDTVTGNSGTATVSRTISNTTAYIKYRINITLNNGDGSYTGVTELRMYEANDYAQNTVAGGGFVCGSTCTITLTRANSLVGTSVLRWTGGAGVTTALNVVSVQEYNYTMLVEGTGTLNMTGNLSQVGGNSVEAVINVTGNCIFNFVGTLTPLAGGNQAEIASLIRLASSCTLNYTGDITSSGLACCIRAVTNGSTINITGNLTNLFESNFDGNQIIISAVATVNITGNCIGRVFSSSVAHYLRLVGSVTAINFNTTGAGRISVVSTNASAINLFSGPFISSPYGFTPLQVVRMHLIPNAASYFEFRDETTNGAVSPGAIAPATRLVSPASVSDGPAIANVRFGTTYALGTLTGTLRMPHPNQVTYGVAVDNTFGNAVLTAASVWDYLVSNITVENSIGMRLKNVSTPQTTGEQLEAFLRLE